jgi:hypothetical protein
MVRVSEVKSLVPIMHFSRVFEMEARESGSQPAIGVSSGVVPKLDESISPRAVLEHIANQREHDLRTDEEFVSVIARLMVKRPCLLQNFTRVQSAELIEKGHASPYWPRDKKLVQGFGVGSKWD